MTSLADAPCAPHSRLLRPRTGLTIVGLAALVMLYTQLQRIAELVKDESIERMMSLGLMSTPGVAIDGKIVISGRIPKAEEVRQLLGVA